MSHVAALQLYYALPVLEIVKCVKINVANRTGVLLSNRSFPDGYFRPRERWVLGITVQLIVC